MLKEKDYIYAKILYSNPKELVVLRTTLLCYGYRGIFEKKNILNSGGIMQSLYTFLIYSENVKTDMEIIELLEVLRRFEFLQILGVIKENMLHVEKEFLNKKINIETKDGGGGVHCNFTRCFNGSIFFALNWCKLLV